jgi:hypothetical protein
MKSSGRSMPAKFLNSVWWLTQMIPMVRKLTRYPANEGHAWPSRWLSFPCPGPWDDQVQREQGDSDREDAVAERLKPRGVHQARPASGRNGPRGI